MNALLRKQLKSVGGGACFERGVFLLLWICINAATKGVKDAVFGVWDGKHCVQHKDDSAAKREKVQSVEECWALAFNNPGVASDHPVTEDEKWGTVGYFFPSTSPNQPHSGRHLVC